MSDTEEPLVEETIEEPVEEVEDEVEELGEDLNEIKLFGKWSFAEIEIRDISLEVRLSLTSVDSSGPRDKEIEKRKYLRRNEEKC